VSKGNEELVIKATDTIESQENGKKKRQGVLAAAKTIGLADKKTAEEKKLKEWIATTPERAKKYGDVIEQMDTLLKEQAKNREKNLIFGKIVGSSTLLSSAVTIARLAEERPKPDLERESGYQERDWQRLEQAQERAQKNYARVIEQGVLELFLGEAAALPADQRPVIYVELFGQEKAGTDAIRAKVSELLDKTALADLDKRIELLRKADPESLKKSTDPLIQLALKALPIVKENEEKGKRLAGAMLFRRPLFFEALNEMNQGRVAPDANSTIRVTFGTVRGFSPAPGKPEYFPFTNVWEMVEKWGKNKAQDPFDAPERIIAAVNEKRFGPYADPKVGGVPIDFLTDLDITGGNSGSPTLNAKGEFTGIVFDGNIEGVGSDLVFQEDVTRAIHADVRYFKWLLDAVDDGGHLLREMGVEPVFSDQK
jgi:hypothetical protein